MTAQEPGPGAEMGQQTKIGRRGRSPQGRDRRATETEITTGNKTDASPSNGLLCKCGKHVPRPVCVCPCVRVPQLNVCPDSHEVRRVTPKTF